MTFPDFSYERPLWAKGFSALGIDEAGRGAFAGPLSVGGVVLDPTFEIELGGLGINDSKLVSPKKRDILFDEIIKRAHAWHVVFISVPVINEVGIGKATLEGMGRVADTISKKVKNSYLLIDAFSLPDRANQRGIIHGDRVSISIAAASILAKVVRDRYMQELSKDFPLYGFEKHKGYGTKFHRDVIALNGLSLHHRIQFCKNTQFVV